MFVTLILWLKRFSNDKIDLSETNYEKEKLLKQEKRAGADPWKLLFGSRCSAYGFCSEFFARKLLLQMQLCYNTPNTFFLIENIHHEAENHVPLTFVLI